MLSPAEVNQDLMYRTDGQLKQIAVRYESDESGPEYAVQKISSSDLVVVIGWSSKYFTHQLQS